MNYSTKSGREANSYAQAILIILAVALVVVIAGTSSPTGTRVYTYYESPALDVGGCTEDHCSVRLAIVGIVVVNGPVMKGQSIYRKCDFLGDILSPRSVDCTSYMWTSYTPPVRYTEMSIETYNTLIKVQEAEARE